MKRVLTAALLIAFATPAALASADLAKDKKCLACHEVEQKVVGPAYKTIAGKYTPSDAVIAKLAGKIRQGGSGVWGVVPMPANPQVNETEAKALASWILSLK